MMAKNSASAFRFYTTREYFDELIVRLGAAKPGDRFLLMTMTFNPIEPTIAVLSRELIRAASRGVHVVFAVDAHSFMLNPAHFPGPMWLRRTLPKRLPKFFQGKLGVLEAINRYPGSYAAIINAPINLFSLPIAGRSHIKAAIINDQLFLGGCNLENENNTDIMIGWKSAKTANVLRSILEQAIRGKHIGLALQHTDYTLPVEHGAELIIDAGKSNQSLIFDEAMDFIDSAEKWLVMTAQYFPNNLTGRHLVAAHRRGVDVRVIASHPRHQGLVGGVGQQINIFIERTRVPKVLFQDKLDRGDPWVHAKLLASDKGVMLGSHNYVRAGVILGTAEIAFKSPDPALARQALETFHRGLRKDKAR